MNVAYIRVSTLEQHEDRQIEGMKKHDISEFFLEKVSGKNADRPQLQEMIKFVRKGDVVYIHSLDRLARNTQDLLLIVQQLKDKGVGLVSNKESIDTTTPTGFLILTVLGAIAEFERTNMLERQAEGIAIAKAKGVYKGRKSIAYPENWKEVFPKYKNREITGTKAMDLLGLKKNTFYKLVKEYESEEV